MVVAADDAQFWKRSQAQQFLGTTAPFVWVSVTFETDIRFFFDDLRAGSGQVEKRVRCAFKI